MSASIDHTFVVLAYKQSPYLEECILSLKNQTVPSRIILSTSTPSNFLEQISARHETPLAVNERGDSIAVDWNFGYYASTTKYVTLAHQDDVYYPTYAEDCLSVAHKNPENLITFTDDEETIEGKVVKRNLNLMVKRLILRSFFLNKQAVSNQTLKHKLLAFGNPISCPTVMLNKETVGDFWFSDHFLSNMDWEAWARLSEKRGSFVYLRKRLVAHRIHSDSQTSTSLLMNVRQSEDRLLLERFWPKPVANLLARLYSLGYLSNS